MPDIESGKKMTSQPSKSIGVISMARNDEFFIAKWIDYYGSQVGTENLYLVLDGHDQPLPPGHEKINVIKVPHMKFGRARGDRNRARLISHMAKALFYRYDIIIAHDIDEFLVVDPGENQSLFQYLQQNRATTSLSGLGLDVGQHISEETSIDVSRPFLEQRRFAHISARYTKPVVAFRPVTWGSGFHRIKGRNFHIDPNLFLFHFGMVDYEKSKSKVGDESLHKSGWTGHLDRRLQLFDLILNNKPVDGDSLFRQARRRQSLFRPLFALNKPGMLTEQPIVTIPERFRSII
ncbi:MAG: glycosyltransferase family 2 protein [Bacteroidales bacterium]|nr:glycosyltransferase family 2 protein [Bacteroidales bacterium]